MKKYLSIAVVSIGSLGILSFILQDMFVTYPDQPLMALHLFKYFTVQSNLFAVVYFALMISNASINKNKAFQNLIGGVMIYTFITFLVFVIFLEGLYVEEGFGIIGNICLHYVNPLLILFYVLTYRKEYTFTFQDSITWIIYPVIYLIFMTIWGIFTKDFLYPFFQVSVIGLGGFIISVIGLVGLFFLLSFLVVKILSKK